jgi:predicted HTH transcriptional regulator
MHWSIGTIHSVTVALISIFDDHIEFTSIGGLVKGITFDDMILGISVKREFEEEMTI